MKVVIGYDGSPCADDAIADLARAGLPEHTNAWVISVADVYLPDSTSESEQRVPMGRVIMAEVQQMREAAHEAMGTARKLADEAADRIRQQFPGWAVKADSRADAPHWGLVEAAGKWGADLIVVGSHGRSALGRFFLGSVSQLVVHNAACSVRIARGRAKDTPPREQRVRLVLGIDGSVDSATAVSAVAARHWPAGTEVHVVGVLDARVLLHQLQSEPPGAPPAGDTIADASRRLNESLAGVCQELRRSGLEATETLLHGDPKKLLLQEAERLGADCIFVGAKGHSRLERLLLGSVSATVSARASCSVEVVRAG
jgi:nucleotide-binding universal stress UspA family protein